ncbi:MAG: phenylalanine--tRNA ligase subunit alpha, partial [Clostridia bacterium]|nr:phenylalanine--tRNA ligase subunit alpha [Clostridia bacterium]
MKEKLEALRRQAEAAAAEALDEKQIEEIRVKYLGKKGEITALLKLMGGLS